MCIFTIPGSLSYNFLEVGCGFGEEGSFPPRSTTSPRYFLVAFQVIFLKKISGKHLPHYHSIPSAT